MGNVIQAGNGQNPARQAALNGGLADHVAALTINKVCGSGLKAVMLAAQGIATGDIDIAVAGGMESMSNAPYLLPRVREGLRMGNGTVVDSMITDGLWCAFEQLPHGHVRRGRRRDVLTSTRGEQDRVRRREPSQGGARDRARAGSRTRSCRSAFPRRREPPVVVDRDEAIREDTTAETLAALKPAFKKDGTRHRRQRAGRQRRRRRGGGHGRRTAPVARDITPLARIVGQATSGLAPKMVLMTPVEAVRKVAAKVGWDLADVDLFEINEAFSVQMVAVLRELGHRPAHG